MKPSIFSPLPLLWIFNLLGLSIYIYMYIYIRINVYHNSLLVFWPLKLGKKETQPLPGESVHPLAITIHCQKKSKKDHRGFCPNCRIHHPHIIHRWITLFLKSVDEDLGLQGVEWPLIRAAQPLFIWKES